VQALSTLPELPVADNPAVVVVLSERHARALVAASEFTRSVVSASVSGYRGQNLTEAQNKITAELDALSFDRALGDSRR
jgi:hypothetical protein